MHEVPVARVSVCAGVLAHGRNKYSIRERNVANRKRIKQASHSVWAAFLNLEQVRCLISQVALHRSLCSSLGVVSLAGSGIRYSVEYRLRLTIEQRLSREG